MGAVGVWICGMRRQRDYTSPNPWLLIAQIILEIQSSLDHFSDACEFPEKTKLCWISYYFIRRFGHNVKENLISIYNRNAFVLHENRSINIQGDSPACSEDMAKSSEVLAFWWGSTLGYCVISNACPKKKSHFIYHALHRDTGGMR